MSPLVKNQYTPETVSPPGATIQDVLNERDMTRGELARQMGQSRDLVDRLIRGTEPLSHEVAHELECALNVPAHFWTRREHHYRTSPSDGATRTSRGSHD